MNDLQKAIAMAKTAAEGPTVKIATMREVIMASLTDAGIKTASEVPNDAELAKVAAYEMALDAMEKFAFAEQLFDEADYVDQVYIKQASDGSDVELDSDGEALEAFLQELDSEVEVDE